MQDMERSAKNQINTARSCASFLHPLKLRITEQVEKNSFAGWVAPNNKVVSSAAHWNRCLSIGEIRKLYNRGEGSGYLKLSDEQRVGLTDWYDFSETASERKI